MTWEKKHPLAGKTVRINMSLGDPLQLHGQEYFVEDYWANMPGNSLWKDNGDRMACLQYLKRTFEELPENLQDDEDNVAYGKIGPFGYLMHDSCLGEVIRDGR